MELLVVFVVIAGGYLIYRSVMKDQPNRDRRDEAAGPARSRTAIDQDQARSSVLTRTTRDLIPQDSDGFDSLVAEVERDHSSDSLAQLASLAAQHHSSGRYGRSFVVAAAASPVLLRSTKPQDAEQNLGFFPDGLLAFASSLGEIRSQNTTLETALHRRLLDTAAPFLQGCYYHSGPIRAGYSMDGDAIEACIVGLAMLAAQTTQLCVQHQQESGSHHPLASESFRIYRGAIVSARYANVSLPAPVEEWDRIVETNGYWGFS